MQETGPGFDDEPRAPRYRAVRKFLPYPDLCEHEQVSFRLQATAKGSEMKLSLFLVEDEPRIRDQLIALTQMSLSAEIGGLAESENEALLWLYSHKGAWKIAVVDLFLKEGTGFGILSHLDDYHSGKVVVLTNSATEENRARCMNLGADAIFDKSLELETFIEYCSALN